MEYTRRRFIERVANLTLLTGLASSSLWACVRRPLRKKSIAETLQGGYYGKLTRNWDPIYGPSIQEYSKYGGPGDFAGHLRGGATPGVDYDVPMGVPLVPSTASFARQIERDKNGALYLLLMDVHSPSYLTYLGHIDASVVDEKFLVAGEVGRYLRDGARALRRDEIVAISGNSGWGPPEYGYRQPPHLHYSLYYWEKGRRGLQNLDPEKFGIDGGRLVFWDGKTRLDVRPEERLIHLEETLDRLDETLGQWPRIRWMEELGGALTEHHRLLRGTRGKEILDSKHFHDLRALLKKEVLERKKYPPGTEPYAMMLKVLGYSTDERQKLILTLPFISPGLVGMYKEPAFEVGPFYKLVPTNVSHGVEGIEQRA
jgi:hypothetical protein